MLNKHFDEQAKADKFVIAVSLVLMLFLIVVVAMFPTQTGETLVSARNGVVHTLGAYFILVTIAMLVFCIWLAMSKYGLITMGKGKPEYSNFNWYSMIFCASIGGAMLYWSALEWTYYVQQPPYGFEPMSPESFDYALPLSYMHWGFMAWGIYTAGVIPLAYRYYNREKSDLSLMSLCEGVMGDKYAHGFIGKILNVLLIFAVLIGLVATYATGIPMLSNSIANIFGLPDTMAMYLFLFLVITVTYAISTFAGLKRGMQRLSQAAVYTIFIILGYVFLFGAPLFSFENSVQSFGILLNDYLMMITYIDPLRTNNYPQIWSCFYWAWWLVLSPWMWIFYAKISKGRSVREIVTVIMIGGSMGTAMFFTVFANYGMHAYLTGTFDVVSRISVVGEYQALSEMLMTLPLGRFVVLLWLMATFFLLTTTMDSAAYTLATTSTLGLRLTNDPARGLRLFWAVMLTIAPVAILYMGKAMGIGAPIDVMKALMILGALPISLICIIAMYAGVKWLSEDYGDKTRTEIADEFKTQKFGSVG